jgi:3alpha(or 20beta)-hydroxysteroid dehydrogenase
VISDRLAGKVAIITGAARGQGASHAQVLAQHGAKVVGTDIRDELGEQVAADIRGAGGSARYRRLDVRSNDDWKRVVDETEQDLGSVDILVNNAGIVAIAGADTCTDDEWDEVIAVNQTGPFRGIRAVIPSMRRAGAGSIVNTASIYGLKGVWGYVAYVASKAGLIGVTRSCAIQYGPEGIRVNAICPSAVATPMLDEELALFENDPYFDWDEWLRTKPIPRVAEPREISELVLYLVSDESRFTTGSVNTIDGGYMA